MNFPTLSAYLRTEVSDSNLVDLVNRIASACWQISQIVRDAAIAGNQGQTEAINPQEELQKPIDLIADEIFRRSFLQNRKVSVLISEEVESVFYRDDVKKGDFVVAYDPLDVRPIWM